MSESISIGDRHKLTNSWWKAKLKDEGGAEGTVGLIPRTYVEEVSSCLSAL